MGNVRIEEFRHLADKKADGSDQNTPVTWKHVNVTKGSTFSYALDSFDIYGNRSAMSEVKSIYNGDVAAPGPITSTSSIRGFKSIEYVWTNPADSDFTGVYIYSDAAKTTKIHEIGGLVPSNIHRKTFTTNTDSESKSIYVTTFDQNRNESVTPVRIFGQASAPPIATNVRDTLSISLKDNNGVQYQKEAFLADNGLTYTVQIISSTAISFTGTDFFCKGYASDGSVIFTQDPGLINNSTGFKLYETLTPFALTGITEGKGGIIVKGQDAAGAYLNASYDLYVDRTVPTISALSLDSGQTVSNDRSIFVKLTYADAGSGVNSYQLSTVAGAPDSGSWITVNTASGTLRTNFNLPNFEKTYTVYGWVKDRAGNISTRKTSDNNIAYKKLVWQPNGNIVTYDLSNNQIYPNLNNWFNSNVRVRYAAIVPSGASGITITAVYWRYNKNGAGWTAWQTPVTTSGTEVSVNIDIVTAASGGDIVSAEGSTYIEFYAKTSQGEVGGTQTALIRIDVTNPAISKPTFWLSSSRSVNRESLLYWKATSGSDGGSGLWKTHIFRSTNISWANAHTVLTTDYYQKWGIDSDDTIESNKNYYYWGRFRDYADNISGTSNPLTVLSTYDWEKEYRNWITNSSFERVAYHGTHLRALDWTSYGEIVQDGAVTPYATSEIAKFGRYSCIGMNPSGSPYEGVGTQVHIPVEENRSFCLSYYVNKIPSQAWSFNGSLYVIFYEANGVTAGTLTSAFAAVTSWTRKSFTFSKTKDTAGATYRIPKLASYAQLFFGQNIGSQKYAIDGVQWEEGLVATDFRDNQSINAQRINAGVIDANHIRAVSINAGHIKAEAITTDLIAASAISAAKMSANSITANNLIAGQIKSTHITAEGLQVKSSGAMSRIVVGDSSNPSSNSYMVMEPSDIYYHPRGYNSGERWHFIKHFEARQHCELNQFFNFQRRFIAPDGNPFTPEIDVNESMNMGYAGLTAPITNPIKLVFGYATASQMRCNILTSDYGANLFYRITDSLAQSINAAGSYTYDLNNSSYTSMATSLAACGWVDYTIPWVGPSGTLQRVSWRIEGSHDNATWVGTTYYQKIYTGTAQSVNYRQAFAHQNLHRPVNRSGIRYYKMSYYANNSGPASITWDQFQWIAHIGGVTWNFLTGTSGVGIKYQQGLCNYQAWDGFLNY